MTAPTKRWKPKEGKYYYYILLGTTEGLCVASTTYRNVDYMNVDLKLGNCFKTQKEVELALTKIKKILRGNG